MNRRAVGSYTTATAGSGTCRTRVHAHAAGAAGERCSTRDRPKRTSTTRRSPRTRMRSTPTRLPQQRCQSVAERGCPAAAWSWQARGAGDKARESKRGGPDRVGAPGSSCMARSAGARSCLRNQAGAGARIRRGTAWGSRRRWLRSGLTPSCSSSAPAWEGWSWSCTGRSAWCAWCLRPSRHNSRWREVLGEGGERARRRRPRHDIAGCRRRQFRPWAGCGNESYPGTRDLSSARQAPAETTASAVDPVRHPQSCSTK